MKLIIVESPTKAKTISKLIKNGFKVESSFGHVRDLPKSKLGVDLENNFEPQYVIPTKAKKTVNNLKKASEKAEKIILATDSDREGEAIAWHLTKALGLDKEESIQRIVFHEITKTAIREALENPRQINMDLVNAQQGRRVLDRIVGYKLSPFLWKKVARGLSAGRVQSVTVRLIVEREEEIRNFKPEEYWTLEAVFQNEKGEKIEAILSKIENRPLEKLQLNGKLKIDEMLDNLRNENFLVKDIVQKEIKKNPPPPFITSTLQQTSSQRLGFSAKKTMLMAQRLYEKGLITYMRTDSVSLSKEALNFSKEWIGREFGAEYASQAPRIFAAKSKLAQEAHEAIRPTDVSKSLVGRSIEEDEKKLYELIRSRFIASQMPQAVFDSTQIDIAAGRYTFRASGSVLKFDGFLKVWKQQFVEKEIPKAVLNERLEAEEFFPKQHFTEPPPRFTEASLIKTLEEYGIGRPSTYAPTISVIQERYYIEKKEGKFIPTETGIAVTKLLIENFPEIVDAKFTAGMEEDLDKIANGEKDWRAAIGEFYFPFSKHLEKKYKEVEKKKIIADEKTDIVCEKCGKPMIVKMSRFGKFLACSGFPECKNTKRIKEEAKKIGLSCPKCKEGELVERRVSKGRARGKIFWGCSRYPKCDYASWENPLNPPKVDKITNT